MPAPGMGQAGWGKFQKWLFACFLFILCSRVVLEDLRRFLCFPPLCPLSNTAKGGDGKGHLDVPFAAMAIQVVVPRFADGLHPVRWQVERELWPACGTCGCG